MTFILIFTYRLSRGKTFPTTQWIHNVESTSFQRLFNVEDIGSTLKRSYFNVVCLLEILHVRLHCNHPLSFTVKEVITKTHLFKYIENFTSKNKNNSEQNSDIFQISAQNIDMLDTLAFLPEVTLNLILYGDESICHENNVSIFSAVQKFIEKTKRF